MNIDEALEHAKERDGDSGWEDHLLDPECSASHFWFDDEEALTVLAKEVERLRAENAELRKRVAFLGEEPLPLSAHELAELAWFRQRDLYRLDQVKAYYGANIDETDVLQAIDELIEWEKANPKPRAGT